MAYYLEGVKEFPKQLSQNMTLTFNSKEYSGTEDIMLFLVANSKSVGGFADAAPLASVSDGYLDVMIIKKMALLTEAPDLIFKLFQENIQSILLSNISRRRNYLFFQQNKLSGSPSIMMVKY